MEKLTLLFLNSGVLISILITCAAVDNITVDQVIRDGDTLVSADEMYRLGFFSPGSSTNRRYLGIWYNNISPQTVVWVANRESPITDSSGVFRQTTNGSLLVTAGSSNTTVWSSNTSLVSLIPRNPVAQLLSSGNLVVREDTNQDSYFWQSFDYPGDTYLAGMKLGKDLVSGLDRRWAAWKTVDDPSPSDYVSFMDTNGFPQLFTFRGSTPIARCGPWNGLTFNGMPENGQYAAISHEFVFNDKEVFYRYALTYISVPSRLYMGPNGSNVHLNWLSRTQEWIVFWSENADTCSQYGLCGPNGRCSLNKSPVCGCMEGFEPQNPDEWSASVWSSGCKRRTPLDCSNKDGFRAFEKVKLPDTRESWYNMSMTLDECARRCRSNCTCMAYSNIDIRNRGSGCMMWFGDLLDVRDVDESQDLYVRMAVSDLTNKIEPGPDKKKSHPIKVILPILSAVVMLSIALLLYAWRRKRKSYNKNKTLVSKDQKKDSELPFFRLNEVVKATGNFSDNNKLGQGGFGAVYKGVLEEGGEIAVKRLSKTSKQGLVEFQNEVICIAKLQHRNLVKLLGCCVEGEEMMLIYEYLPNKSLDSFLFDTSNSLLLDWRQRYNIINGIARGLLYLHQDSRLRIIHRDIKASNILLDSNMNPKISDFGLARLFKEYETEANTNHIVGTLGYISPEYATNGLFSLKSDVFSFGVLVLEIISGKKNRGFTHQNHQNNLLGHAWRLYKEAKPLELVDVALGDSWNASLVLQSIHIGLSCVQQHADDRPSMSSVVHMLGGEGALPPPKHPGFFTEITHPRFESSLIMPQVPISINKITATQLEGR